MRFEGFSNQPLDPAAVELSYANALRLALADAQQVTVSISSAAQPSDSLRRLSDGIEGIEGIAGGCVVGVQRSLIAASFSLPIGYGAPSLSSPSSSVSPPPLSCNSPELVERIVRSIDSRSCCGVDGLFCEQMSFAGEEPLLVAAELESTRAALLALIASTILLCVGVACLLRHRQVTRGRTRWAGPLLWSLSAVRHTLVLTAEAETTDRRVKLTPCPRGLQVSHGQLLIELRPVRLYPPINGGHHIFLSHVWSHGQDQCALLHSMLKARADVFAPSPVAAQHVTPTICLLCVLSRVCLRARASLRSKLGARPVDSDVSRHLRSQVNRGA